MKQFDPLDLHSDWSPYGWALVLADDSGLVRLTQTTRCLALSSTVELHPNVARRLAALLIEAADFAQGVKP